MDRVIESLQQGKNALLESPTGTGKTLCLLCASLAWRRTFGEFLRVGRGGGGTKQLPYGSQPSASQQSEDSTSQKQQQSRYPVIIYASRTHSQLRQVIKELKATSYRPKMAVLGSREQMCIHDEVSKLHGRAQNNACHFLCKKRRCPHNNHVAEFIKNKPELGNEPFDIEDLINIGRHKGPCPYYISRELSKSVDILFAPYNYLIDPGNRRSLNGIPWDNAVLIFDEAHNLESICADAASFDLFPNNLTACIAEAHECIKLCSAKRSIENSADKQFDPENYAILKALLMALEKKIAELLIGSELGYTKAGSYIYDFLSELNITSDTSKKLIETIDCASLLLEEGNSAQTGPGVQAKAAVSRLESIRDMLDIIFRGGGQNHAKYYRFHVNESQQTHGDALKFLGKSSRTLSWWCFNPGLAMEEFLKLGVRSIILTSGTLSPLDSLAMELNLEFPVRLENPHVISSDQVWVGVVPVGPSGHALNSSYRTRNTIQYKQELGTAIVNFARIVPDGLLVFFPSYSMMDMCVDFWKNRNHSNSASENTIWQRICKHKQPVIEPRQSSNFQSAIEDYRAKLHDSSSGAIFFAVCRGKVSEGLDFADRAGRAVIVTGMPFATPTDAKVRLKREYLDKQGTPSNKNTKMLTGEEWYVQQAARAVNQAVGRVIRHRHDYGAIIYCDERFVWPNYQSQMSYWLRPHIKCYSKYGEVVQGLTRFFRDKASSDPLTLEPTDCNNCIAPPANKHMLKEKLSDLAASAQDECPQITLSGNSTMRRSNFMKLAQITPANRSTLTTKHNFVSTSTKHNLPEDQLSQDTNVDITVDLAIQGHLKEHTFKSLGLKKAKTMDRSKDAVVLDDVSSKLPQNIGSRALARYQCGGPTPESKKSTIATECGKNDGACEKTEGQESNSGPAFLKLVQEKLSPAEYTEFVEYMKALKLKTMHTKDSLEAITKLFSSPGRLPLLEGFRVFVAKNHLPLYEQLVRRHNNVSST